MSLQKERNNKRKIIFFINFGMFLVVGLITIAFREEPLVLVGGTGMTIILSMEVIPYKKVINRIKKAISY